MSAETEMQNLLDHAANGAATLASRSASLVETAVATLESPIRFPLTPPYAPQRYGVVDFDHRPIVEREPPIAFPVWPSLTLAEPPGTRDLETITGDVDVSLEALRLPTLTYSRIADLPAFTSVAPTVTTAFGLPTAPEVTLPPAPAPLPLKSLTVPTLSVSPPTFAPITTAVTFDPKTFDTAFQQFKGDIFNGAAGVPGLENLLAELQTWTEGMLGVVLPEVLSLWQVRFTDQYAPVLAFHAQLQARLAERLTAETARVLATLTDTSGWELPVAVQNAQRAAALQVAQSWRQHALSQAETQTAELALDFFELCGTVFAQLNRGIQEFKTKEIESVLEAHRLSLAYAKQVLAGLLAAYEADVFTRQDAEFQKAQAQLAVFEAELQVAFIQFEVANAQLQIEQAKQSQDANLIKQFQTDAEVAGLEIRLYAEQVAAARSELELKALPMEIFGLQVRAFDAQVNAHQALTNARLAEIESDSARLEGELAKVKAFEAEAQGFEKLVATRQRILTAQIDRNATVLAEFEAKAKAQLAPIEYSVLQNQYELAKYQVRADDALSDAKLALAKAQTDLEFSHKEQDGQMTVYQATRERALDLMKTELDRLKSIAEVSEQGAQIMAQMAGGAMSAANGIANVIFQESA